MLKSDFYFILCFEISNILYLTHIRHKNYYTIIIVELQETLQQRDNNIVFSYIRCRYERILRYYNIKCICTVILYEIVDFASRLV